jgi:hypothetical protein
VALDDEALVEVTLHLGGNAQADISFGDYGANLAIDPVDAPTTLLER